MQTLKLALCALLIGVLTRCGGSGGGIVDPPDPDPTFSAQLVSNNLSCTLLNQDPCAPSLTASNADSVKLVFTNGSTSTYGVTGVPDDFVALGALLPGYRSGNIAPVTGTQVGMQVATLKVGKYFKGSFHWKDGNGNATLNIAVSAAVPGAIASVEMGACASSQRTVIVKTSVPTFLPETSKYAGTQYYESSNTFTGGDPGLQWFHYVSPTQAEFYTTPPRDLDTTLRLVNPAPGGGDGPNLRVHITACPH
jgi:hypothetical protein